MFKKLFATLSLIVAMALPSVTQNLNPPTTVQAERMVLMLAGDPNNGPSYVTGMGLSPNGVATVLSDSQAFYAQQNTNVTLSNQEATDYYNGVIGSNPPDQQSFVTTRDNAVVAAFQDLYTNLSIADYAALEVFVNAESNNMGAPAGGDLVGYSTKKFTGGNGGGNGDDGLTEIAGDNGLVYIDGYSGTPSTCSVRGSASESTTINSWSSVATVPTGTTQLFTATDGTMLVNTSSNAQFVYDETSASFVSIGTGKEVTGSYNQGIYSIGTDNKLYSFNSWTFTWSLTGGTDYPFTTVSHVAADGDDSSVFVSNGTTIAAFVPPLNKWVNLGNATYAPVSLTTHFNNNLGLQNWSAMWIGTDGKFYSVMYSYPSGSIYWSPAIPYTGYTGTPKTVRLAADHTVTFLTSDNKVWQTGPFGQITGQTGSVASADGVNGVYVVNSSGTIMQWGGAKTTYSYESGVGNHYFSDTNTAPINNLQNNGAPWPDTSNENVTQTCGTVHTVLLDNQTFTYVEIAKTLVFQPQLQSLQHCIQLDTGNHCAKYNVTEDCTSLTNPPDLLYSPVFVQNYGNNVPFGFLETSLCTSNTGKQPYSCLIPYVKAQKTSVPAYTCTQHK